MEKRTEKAPANSLDAYQNSIHKWGRIGVIVIVGYMVAMPFILGLVYDCMPSPKVLVPVIAGTMAIYTVSALGEVFSYTPILGSASYLTFVTGNISNLKFPVVMNALKMAEVDQNTEEADAIGLVAVAVSSLLTMLIIILGVLLIAPLTPLFENPNVKTATDYMLPALFGALIYGFLFRDTGKTHVKRKGIIPILPIVLIGLLIVLKVIEPSYATLMVIVALPLNIWLSRVLYKKGILAVETIETKAEKLPSAE